MTSLQKIKEIEDAVPTIFDGMKVNKRWAPTGRVLAKPFRDDFEFLLKAFNVMREIAIEANGNSGDRVYGDLWFEDLDAEFEKRIK